MRHAKHQRSEAEKETYRRAIMSYLGEIDGTVRFAYLFGSFTKGSTFGDIDIALWLQPPVEDRLAFELDCETQIERQIKLPVDVRVLNGAPLSFRYQVIRQGQVILDRDSDLRATFEGMVLKQYFDFAPFRKRYLKEFGHAAV